MRGPMRARKRYAGSCRLWRWAARPSRLAASARFSSFSPGGTIVAGATRGKIVLWDRETGKMIRELPRPEETFPNFALFPDGKSILGVVDVTTGANMGKFPNARNPPYVLAVAPDGRSAATIRATNLTLYDILTFKERLSVDLPTWSDALAYSPDNRLLVSGGRDGIVRLWDVSTGRAIQQLTGHVGRVDSLAFSADGRWFISTAANTALVWDVEAILRR